MTLYIKNNKLAVDTNGHLQKCVIPGTCAHCYSLEVPTPYELKATLTNIEASVCPCWNDGTDSYDYTIQNVDGIYEGIVQSPYWNPGGCVWGREISGDFGKCQKYTGVTDCSGEPATHRDFDRMRIEVVKPGINDVDIYIYLKEAGLDPSFYAFTHRVTQASGCVEASEIEDNGACNVLKDAASDGIVTIEEITYCIC